VEWCLPEARATGEMLIKGYKITETGEVNLRDLFAQHGDSSNPQNIVFLGNARTVYVRGSHHKNNNNVRCCTCLLTRSNQSFHNVDCLQAILNIYNLICQ
jgi:hypothetical protein